MGMKKADKLHIHIVLYLVFGVLTTLVNTATYWAVKRFLSQSGLVSSVVAWFVAVIFAYVTNRKWVFQSKAVTGIEVMKETLRFFTSRLATGIIDWLSMWLLVDILCVRNDVSVKLVVNVLVIILNYLASKLLVFKSHD